MAGIQFVIEAPQADQTRRKRARLVTSCDHCRFKKVKCFQPSQSSTCEACANAGIPCQYRDRERYFTERSRIISRSTPSSRSSSSVSPDLPPQASISIPDTRRHPSSNASASPSPSVKSDPYLQPSADFAYNHANPSWQFDSPSDNQDLVQQYLAVPMPQSWHASLSAPAQYHARSKSAICGTTQKPLQNTQRAPSTLFDPNRSDHPNPALMAHFIQTYFDHYGHFFPFLFFDDIVQRFVNQTLPPLLATCIAALAAWWALFHTLDVRAEVEVARPGIL